jgi:G:T/U-mismatch repair DNA glycosylase
MTFNAGAGAIFERHPYNSEIIPVGTEALIVGTAPPPRFSLPRPPHEGPKKGWDADFYYGSDANHLWLYLERAAGETIFAEPGTPEAAKEDTESLMRDLLRRHSLWMRDILQSYRRKPGKERRARDDDIDVRAAGTEYMQLVPLLEVNKEIRKIAFTSEKAAEWTFEPVNEKKLIEAFDFKKRLRDWKKENEEVAERHKTALKRDWDLGGRNIDFYILPTPSGAGRGSGERLAEQEIIEIYRSVLFPHVVRDSE